MQAICHKRTDSVLNMHPKTSLDLITVIYFNNSVWICEHDMFLILFPKLEIISEASSLEKIVDFCDSNSIDGAHFHNKT